MKEEVRERENDVELGNEHDQPLRIDLTKFATKTTIQFFKEEHLMQNLFYKTQNHFMPPF